MGSRIVVALGGNALQRQGGASATEQQAEAALTARRLLPLIKQGHQIVIVHGNGPQVGAILLHQEAVNTVDVPSMSLNTCVAMSQGMIGYWLQQAFYNELKSEGIDKKVSTLVTQVLVDREDPAFANPSKPIGPFYKDEAEAYKIGHERNFVVKSDADRGWRRVVASPSPKVIIEKDSIEQLIVQNHLVIAVGGGGVPVIEKDNKLSDVEAVIDKDMSASVLADSIDAELLLILTPIDSVKINFGKTNEESLHQISCEDLQKYIDQNEFAPGSMLPKILASVDFVNKKRGYRKAIIASLDGVGDAINNQSGTEIY